MMYSYKLNNSYTVYLNYTYLNECIKASKKKSKPIILHNDTKSSEKPVIAIKPFPKNTRLQHKTFGSGKVVSTDKYGIMNVEFNGKIIRFVYPDAINQGYLTVIH